MPLRGYIHAVLFCSTIRYCRCLFGESFDTVPRQEPSHLIADSMFRKKLQETGYSDVGAEYAGRIVIECISEVVTSAEVTAYGIEIYGEATLAFVMGARKGKSGHACDRASAVGHFYDWNRMRWTVVRSNLPWSQTIYKNEFWVLVSRTCLHSNSVPKMLYFFPVSKVDPVLVLLSGIMAESHWLKNDKAILRRQYMIS